jgi:hypothetical protein
MTRFPRRTRPYIAWVIEIIQALPRTVGKLLLFRQPLGELLLPGRQIIQHLVRKRIAEQRVPVDGDQCVTSIILRMDHHTVAAISITGTCLDVLGSLYLAYDLLGGRHGPLRLLTRAVTYSVVFGIGYGIGLGLFFGLASGITAGITIAIELNRAARGLDHYSLAWEGMFSAIRAFGFGAGLYRIVGIEFAIAFSLLITAGQIFAYSRSMRPATDYAASRRPRLTRRQFWGTVVRTIGYTAAALLCSAFIHHVDHAWSFAIRVGLVTGLVTGVGATVNPYIEYYADNLPERWLGAFGIGLILCGFALQSVQYWFTLFDVRLA